MSGKVGLQSVIINALQYKQESSGIGVLIRELFTPFCERIDWPCTVVLSKNSPDFQVKNPLVTVVRSPYGKEQNLRRLWFQSFRLGHMARNCVLVTVDSKIPFYLSKTTQILPIITDLAVYRHSDTYQTSRVLLWKLQFFLLRRRAERFCAISNFTRQEIIALFHTEPNAVRVLPCAASREMYHKESIEKCAAIRAKYDLPERYVLFVGNLNPRKNMARAIRAFDHVKSRAGLPHGLVLAGGQGWKFDRKEALEGISCRDALYFLGYVADGDLPCLYTMADAFLFPTLYEGFGLPILEAQQCGTPVLAGNTSAMPEVGGDGALYADPYSVEDIAEKLERLLTDQKLAQELRVRGYGNIRRFSWQKSARLLDQYLKEEEGVDP